MVAQRFVRYVDGFFVHPDKTSLTVVLRPAGTSLGVAESKELMARLHAVADRHAQEIKDLHLRVAFGGTFPIFIAEYDPGHFWYGFPDVGDGLKVALHHDGEYTTADTVRRDVDADEIAAVRSLLQRFLPDANGDLLETAVCLYTNAPDDHFIIDRPPDHPAVVIASPCSGHGFKFSSAIV